MGIIPFVSIGLIAVVAVCSCVFVSDLEDTSFECMWVWLGSVRLPRQISGLMCAILYNPPDTALPEMKNLGYVHTRSFPSVFIPNYFKKLPTC